MSLARQAVAVARVEAGQGTSDDRAMVLAWNRLTAMLSALDSKTSVLLRFNAIVVAALAYLVVVRGTDPFAASSATVKAIGLFIGHVSLLASVVSCGFAFPVINVAWSFFGSRIDRATGDAPTFDAAALEGLGALVVRRTRLYSWAWQFAVAGGLGFAILVGLATIH
jgi:hypothetical protein